VLVKLRRWFPVLVAALLLLPHAAPAAAASPNTSILLWKPGKAVTGTLKERVYAKVATFSLSGVDLATASRSSLALYTQDTGRLRTGTFRNGRYTFVDAITVRTGFTHAASSCDTLFLYNRGTGRYLIGTLVGGRFQNRSSGFIAAGWDRASATCSGLLLFRRDPSNSVIQGYALSGGDLVAGGAQTVVGSPPPVRLATTRNSFMFLVPHSPGPFGAWGTASPASDPPIAATDSDTNFVAWAIIAGTGDSLMFYNPDGSTCRWWLVDGDIEGSSCSGSLPKNLKVIAGGK
jgi:hypothetical protein